VSGGIEECGLARGFGSWLSRPERDQWQALDGLVGSPFVKPFVLLFKKLRQLLSGKKSS